MKTKHFLFIFGIILLIISGCNIDSDPNSNKVTVEANGWPIDKLPQDYPREVITH